MEKSKPADNEKAQLQQALSEIVLRYMPNGFFGLGSLYLALAIGSATGLAPLSSPTRTILAGGMAGALFLLWFIVRRVTLPYQLAHPLTALIILLSLGISLYNLIETGNPIQTAGVGLVIFAAGFFMLSTHWLIVILLTAVGGWFFIISQQEPAETWTFLTNIILAASALSLIINVSRIKHYRHLEKLRLLGDAQRKELERRAQQLEMTMSVSRHLASMLDLDKLLKEVATEVQRQYGAYFVGIYLMGREKEYLVAQAGRNTEQVENNTFKIVPGGILDWAARNRQVVRVDDVLQDGRYIPLEAVPDTRSMLALPLLFGTKLLGVLDIRSDQPASFNLDDEKVLGTLADHIAVAIHNATLYQQLEYEVEQRTQFIKVAYNQLEQLDRTKSDFIGIISHELRTPLAVVTGYSHLLANKAQKANHEEYYHLANGILQGMQRMQEVFNSMLDILKIESQALNLYFEPVSISALVRQINKQLAGVLDERNLTLVQEEEEELPFIEGDAQLLEKVMLHLLTNAVKYTPDGGEICISTRLIKASEEEGEAAVDRVEIRIRDTGIGIEPAVQSLIFEKFYQTGKIDLHSSSQTQFKGGGPGLGLAIAKGLVEGHHGRIWVESSGFDETTLPGSTFYVHLPVRQEEE